MDDELRKEPVLLAEQQNKIIHEASILMVKEDKAKQAFDDTREFLRWLGEASFQNGVPVYGPGNLVT